MHYRTAIMAGALCALVSIGACTSSDGSNGPSGSPSGTTSGASGTTSGSSSSSSASATGTSSTTSGSGTSTGDTSSVATSSGAATTASTSGAGGASGTVGTGGADASAGSGGSGGSGSGGGPNDAGCSGCGPGRVQLQNGWSIQASNATNGATGSQISTVGFATTGWRPTTVPATVLAALVANKVYADPFIGDNLTRIPASIASTSWWYRVEFTPAA